MRCCGCLENLIWILRRRVYGRIELDSRGKMEIKACEMSLEQWMGPWNDIEGNVPHTAQLQAFIFQLSQRIHYNFFFSVCIFVLDFIFKVFPSVMSDSWDVCTNQVSDSDSHACWGCWKCFLLSLFLKKKKIQFQSAE